ncbi:uncharacterized protein LOC120666679 [Panicum virgatum]|uniref:Maternal effect embryo arrest 60 n=1 Tax=Panicum virgatum TaxID=38727 RepID=A0A8T0W553_PANVG|nr:uncharacterized protein LOC120666679 [Panicum virgatum]KAG2641036.1 hypothetical protein PVAP13_2KG143064 [Panicum virgatum]
MDGGDIAAGGGGGGGGTSIHVTALDGIVNVNSLFTLAAFVGLAWRPSADGPGLAAGADRAGSPCAAGDRAESDLVSFHVLAFACFLFSSLVALCLKQLVRTFPPHRRRGAAAGPSSSSSALGRTARINRAALRVGILASAVGSVAGCGFLMMALVNVVQVKLGRLGCGAGGSAAWAAVVPLVTLVPAAMLIYIGIVFYAFTR